MRKKKGLYPDKSVYTQQLGPGLCFGALALMLRFFFEVPSPGGMGLGVQPGGPGAPRRMGTISRELGSEKPCPALQEGERKKEGDSLPAAC